jgi:hypothetical protein
MIPLRIKEAQKPGLLIRIWVGPMILGLPDLNPDVRDTDPDPSIIKQKYKENIDSFFMTFSL